MTSTLRLKMIDDMPLREAVFITLREAILSGVLAPGERLMEIPISLQLGVSRTPVRESIRRLTSEGLAISIPRQGARVAAPPRAEFDDLLEILSVLESLAAAKACRHITEKELASLTSAAKDFEVLLQTKSLL